MTPSQTAVEEDPALARSTIESYYLGAVSILSHFAPILEAQRGGNILILGSVAKDCSRLTNYLYGSTKAALHVYPEGLRATLFPANVTVTLIKPGLIDTALTWGMPPMLLAGAEQCARSCLKSICRRAATVYVSFWWWGIMFLILPAGILTRLKF
jgi:decaprenylphospho-beta-D-erythro-pentofuranosid-2-ulose 2-reductase